jgi:hypothetical protein
MTRSERDELLRQLAALEAQLYPDDESQEPTDRAALRLQDEVDRILGEYADRLPRIVMGASPFTGEPLLRSFDPFGLDGPWWWKDRPFKIDEPDAPPGFQVLLGALALNGRKPVEATDELIPGPEVPFVVPRLLELPNMVAVVTRLELETGDVAYPISYWSTATIDPADLHQPWLRQELWFSSAEGAPSWLISTAPWDFDLAKAISSDQLMWIAPRDPQNAVLGRDSGQACPYANLAGGKQPQSIVAGERDWLDLPDGVPVEPFET